MSQAASVPSIEPPVSFPVPSISRHPSESSSERKRRRLNESPSSYRSQSEFPSYVKHEVKRTYRRCWNCDATPVQMCYVIGKADSRFDDLRRDGLLTFDTLNNEQNAIGLCPTCHANFDDLTNPGLVLLPTDLQYFIHFEQNNYKSRASILRDTGRFHTRACPSAQDYEQHQRDNQTLSGGVGDGGLYDRYILTDFLPKGCRPNGGRPGKWDLDGPKQWRGAPTAAIRRAMMASGSSGTGWLSQQVKQQLRELQDLYDRDLSELAAEQSSSRRRDSRSPSRADEWVGQPPQQQPPPQPRHGHDSAAPQGPYQAQGHSSNTTRSHPTSEHEDGVGQGTLCDSAVDVNSSIQVSKNAEETRQRLLYNVYMQQQDRIDLVIPPGSEWKSTTRGHRGRKRGRYHDVCDVEEDWWTWGPTSTSADKISCSRKRRQLFVASNVNKAAAQQEPNCQTSIEN